MDAYGEVDELNSVIGLLLSEAPGDDIGALLTDIQHRLFDLGGELSIPGHRILAEAHVAHLEATLDELL